MKLLIVLGTRPEAIKFAPLIHALKNSEIDTLVCVSGQHKDMLAPMLSLFNIVPDITLNTMSPGQSLNVLSSKLLAELDRVLDESKPDWVLVQGDTTTAMCAGLAAFHRKIKVGHIEAGLRTGDLDSPFPEEANRNILSRIANLHFAPTELARQALLNEGIKAERIVVTGNTVVDAIALALSISAEYPIPDILKPTLLSLEKKPLILVTCHRRENFGFVLENICNMLRRLCGRYHDYNWIFPVHLNPNIKEPVHRLLSGIPNLILLPPVDYVSNLKLISHASLILTDSGGIQEEAPSFGVPVVVMRNHTERMDGVYAGVASLAGQDPVQIEQEVDKWLTAHEKPSSLVNRLSPYGDGLASERIVNVLLDKPVAEFVYSAFAR